MTRVELDAEVKARSGCLALRKARSTKTLVGLYRAKEAGIESDPRLKWATVCEEHGCLVCHETRSMAEVSLSQPQEWCPDCQEMLATRDAQVTVAS